MAFKHTLQAGIMKLMSKQITTPKKIYFIISKN
jgi:hypothetical protein